GFAQGVLFAGSRFTAGARYTNSAVYDTDLVDRTVDNRGGDNSYFDRGNRAIAYFTGHGITDHGCSTVTCTTSAACTNPATALGGGVPRPRGACRFSPFAMPPRCCYMVDRQAVTNSPQNRFNGLVNYTRG